MGIRGSIGPLIFLICTIAQEAHAGEELLGIAVSKSPIKTRVGAATAVAVGFEKPCVPEKCSYSIFSNSVAFKQVSVPTPPVTNKVFWNGSLAGVAVIAGDVWAVGNSPQLNCYQPTNFAAGKCPPTPYEPAAVYPLVVRMASSGSNLAQWHIESTPLINLSNFATDNFLYGIAGSGAKDIWTVGVASSTDASSQPIIFHWNGTVWSAIQNLNLATSSYGNVLESVTSISVNDAWAVGWFAKQSGTGALVHHWDGTSWNIVTAQDVGTFTNQFAGVSGSVSTSVWAVGSASDQLGGSTRTLVEHWNGSAWLKVPSSNIFPGPKSHNDLLGVAARLNDEAWMVGCADDGSGKRAGMIFHHHNGSWKTWTIPRACLRSVAIISGSDVWAAGNSTLTGHTLVMRFNGTQWKPVPTP